MSARVYVRVFVALLVGSVLLTATTEAQTTWYVDDDAPPGGDGSPEHPFDAIQEALDVAADGDTVIVLPGAYVENITFPAEAITLRSIYPQDPAVVDATVINGGYAGSVVTFSPGAPSDAVIDGFTIRSGDANAGGGIDCWSAGPTIIRCIIRDNSAVYQGGGISCGNGAAPTIVDCVLRYNMGGGLACDNSSPIVVDCTIEDN